MTINYVTRARFYFEAEAKKGNKVIAVVSAMSGVTNNLIDQVKKTSENFPYSEYDTVVSSGEQVTSALLSIALEELSIKARSWLGWQVPIITDDIYGKAVIKNIETAICHYFLFFLNFFH